MPASVGDVPAVVPAKAPAPSVEDFEPDLAELAKPRYLHDLPQLRALLDTDSVVSHHVALTWIDRLLVQAASPLIDECIDRGLLPIFVHKLRSPHARLRFLAAGSLTNIAAGKSHQTAAVVAAGAIEPLVEMLGMDDAEGRHQAAWALGNIAGDSLPHRAALMEAGAVPALIAHLHAGAPLDYVRRAVWMLGNTLRLKPLPTPDQRAPIVRALAKALYSQDEEVLGDALWGLSCLTDGDEPDALQGALEAGVAKQLVHLLGHSQTSVQTPALRTLGNIVSGDETQAQAMINAGCLDRLAVLLKEGKSGLKKEACWAVSNITAGTAPQTAAVLCTDIVETLCEISQGAKRDLRREACWAISNATSSANHECLYNMLQRGCHTALGSALIAELHLAAMGGLAGAALDARVAMVALEGLQNFLTAAPGLAAMAGLPADFVVSAFSEKLVVDPQAGEELSVPDLLQMAQESGDNDLVQLATQLMNQYFGEHAG